MDMKEGCSVSVWIALSLLGPRVEIQLPLWQPPSHLAIPAPIRDHITHLKIPINPSSPQRQSLLLHNLGQLSHDPRLVERVDNLFRLNSK